MRPGSRLPATLVVLGGALIAVLAWLLPKHGANEVGPAVAAIGAALPNEPAAARPSPSTADEDVDEQRAGPVVDDDNRATANAAETSSANARPRPAAARDELFPRDWHRCFREYAAGDGYSILADSTTAWSGSASASIASRVARPGPSG